MLKGIFGGKVDGEKVDEEGDEKEDHDDYEAKKIHHPVFRPHHTRDIWLDFPGCPFLAPFVTRVIIDFWLSRSSMRRNGTTTLMRKAV